MDWPVDWNIGVIFLFGRIVERKLQFQPISLGLLLFLFSVSLSFSLIKIPFFMPICYHAKHWRRSINHSVALLIEFSYKIRKRFNFLFQVFLYFSFVDALLSRISFFFCCFIKILNSMGQSECVCVLVSLVHTKHIGTFAIIHKRSNCSISNPKPKPKFGGCTRAPEYACQMIISLYVFFASFFSLSFPLLQIPSVVCCIQPEPTFFSSWKCSNRHTHKKTLLNKWHLI